MANKTVLKMGGRLQFYLYCTIKMTNKKVGKWVDNFPFMYISL